MTAMKETNAVPLYCLDEDGVTHQLWTKNDANT